MPDKTAVILVELGHLKQLHEDNLERIKKLEEYKSKTERYGFFLLGIIALGTLLAAGIEKAVSNIMAVVK